MLNSVFHEITLGFHNFTLYTSPALLKEISVKDRYWFWFRKKAMISRTVFALKTSSSLSSLSLNKLYLHKHHMLLATSFLRYYPWEFRSSSPSWSIFIFYHNTRSTLLQKFTSACFRMTENYRVWPGRGPLITSCVVLWVQVVRWSSEMHSHYLVLGYIVKMKNKNREVSPYHNTNGSHVSLLVEETQNSEKAETFLRWQELISC